MLPHLSDALSMMFGNGPRHTVQHASVILRIDAERLYAALEPLVAGKVIEVHGARTPEETWRITGAGGEDVLLPELIARIEQLAAEGELPKHVLNTPLD